MNIKSLSSKVWLNKDTIVKFILLSSTKTVLQKLTITRNNPSSEVKKLVKIFLLDIVSIGKIQFWAMK